MTVQKLLIGLAKGIIILFFAIFILLGLYKYFYYKEMRSIKSDLNNISGVKVLNIWGHDDITLEEITARISIEGKGQMVLGNLSKDEFRYPTSVPLSEIGGYSFTSFSCFGSMGISSGINIGTESEIGKLINITFRTPKDVIDNYDKILRVIDSLPHSPELAYFSNERYEQYLLISKEKSKDQDPIFLLIGVEGLFEYGRKLNWKNAGRVWG